jgi:hypothetical protein
MDPLKLIEPVRGLPVAITWHQIRVLIPEANQVTREQQSSA